jgi:GDP-mannose 6-dehydrogenase
MSLNLSIFGLGYVGTVSAACLAGRGHHVIGVDMRESKVAVMNRGRSPVIETGLDTLVFDAHASGRLRATTEVEEAVRESVVSLICVGSPALATGRLSLDSLRHVSTQLRDALRGRDRKHTLVFRSTMLPGSTRQLVGEFFGDMIEEGWLTVYFSPEFLREGSAIRDFQEPSLSVIGTGDGKWTVDGPARELFGEDPTVMTWEGAEMVKYACNAFHALKVGFANEIGRLSKHLALDGAEVMEVLCQDERLNASSAYLRPGNPFGGSCLPKDVSALGALARMEGVSLPLIDQLAVSNEAHLSTLIQWVVQTGARRVGLLGLAFKAGTDDLRGSPMVTLAETLLGRGYELHIFDPHVEMSRLVGANEAEIQRRMPHLASLLRGSANAVVENSDVVVVGQACADIECLRQVARPEQRVLDVNGWRALRALPWQYEGLCW